MTTHTGKVPSYDPRRAREEARVSATAPRRLEVTIVAEGSAFFEAQIPETEDGDGERWAPERELARILRVLASRLETELVTAGGLRDVNGNTVGDWHLSGTR
jgi:hypothetical protein